MIGWVSTWNEKCGIAAHSENILAHLGEDFVVLAPRGEMLIREDEDFVRRCWSKKDGDFSELVSCALEEGITTALIQHHPGIMLFSNLNVLIHSLVDAGIEVSVILHNTKERPLVFRSNRIDRAVPGMRLCRKVIVHQSSDVNRLRELGVDGNTALVPHGVYPPPSGSAGLPVPEGRVMGTFGFMMSHKGFTELIQAFSELDNWDYLVMLCSVREDSGAALKECEDMISRLGLGDRVLLQTEFLEQDYAISTLSSLELVVFPYQNTKESASGAVRMAVAAGTAIAVTPLDIFDDVEGAIVLQGRTAAEMVSSLDNLDDASLGDSRARIIEMRDAHQWPSVSMRLRDLIL
ncbi:MAG: hypothetical protein NZ780_04195 [Candidatus Poseidoniales archaeon]|nr:hypothetical protein [Candidatus Poseidoniales archaeon]